MTTDLPDSPSSKKEELRARFRAYRRTLGDAAYERLSLAIVEHAAALPALRSARRVHIYWPLIDRREVDTRPLIARLESKGVEIVLPVVASFERGRNPLMSHVRYPGAEKLRKNRWGIAEPEGGEDVDIATLDAVVVPALGAGRNRHRIGQGRGYYDAFLAGVAAPKICLIYDACLVDVVPFEEHDVAMNAVVTERETLRELPL